MNVREDWQANSFYKEPKSKKKKIFFLFFFFGGGGGGLELMKKELTVSSGPLLHFW